MIWKQAVRRSPEGDVSAARISGPVTESETVTGVQVMGGPQHREGPAPRREEAGDLSLQGPGQKTLNDRNLNTEWPSQRTNSRSRAHCGFPSLVFVNLILIRECLPVLVIEALTSSRPGEPSGSGHPASGTPAKHRLVCREKRRAGPFALLGHDAALDLRPGEKYREAEEESPG